MTDRKPAIATLAQRLAPPSPARRTLPLVLGDRAVTLTFGPYRALADAVRHSFAVGSGVARLDLPRATLDWLLAPLVPPQDAVQRGMLIELACLNLLHELGEVRATNAPCPDIAFGVTVDNPALSFALHLDPTLAGALNDHLDRHAPPPEEPDDTDLEVPVTLRLGHQYLSEAEIASLGVGDVVMTEPGPVLLLVDDFAASVSIEGRGPVMRSELMPLPVPAPRADHHVTFVAAQSRMTLGTLSALDTDDLIPMAVFDDTCVDLVAGGRAIARGQPVMIGAGHGFRILHLSTMAR